MRLISRSWAARLPALPSFTYGFKIRLLLFLGPASIEFRVLAFWSRADFSHIHQRGSLNTLSQYQGTSRGILDLPRNSFSLFCSVKWLDH